VKKTILSAALAAAAMPVYASDTLLPPVVVSATRSEQSSVTTPSSITIITAQQIAASGATSLAQILDDQGGIQVKDYYGDGSRATIGMRGITGGNAASNTLIMIDGRRLNNPDIGAPDLANIPLQDIERIEIIQGSAGTLFGDQAVGGVINIITRRPHKRQLHLALQAGSYNTRGADASLSNRDGAFAYRLSATARKSDNYRDHNARDYADYSGRVDYTTHSGGDLFGEFEHSDENLQLPGSLTAAQVAQDPRQVVGQNNRTAFNDSHSDMGRLGLRQSIDNNWSVEGELTSRTDRIDGNLFGGYFRQRREHLGLTPRLIGSFANAYGTALLTVGSDLNQFHYSYVSAYGTTKTTQDEQALYAQLVAPIAPALNLTVGGRHAEARHHITDTTAFPGGRTLTDRVNVWELGLSYKPAPHWRLYARRDGNFRFAKVDEETYTSPGVVGLAPQTGVSYEMGAEWHHGAQHAKAVIYRLDLNNEIDYDASAPGPFGPGANINLSPTRRTGLILQAHLVPLPDLALEGSYTYVDPRMHGGPYDGKQIPFVARNSARLSADWTLSSHWSLFGDVVYTGPRYMDSDYSNSHAPLPSLSVLNANLTYRWQDWKLSARINNLTDRHYMSYATYSTYNSSYYYPAPRRNVIVTASFNM